MCTSCLGWTRRQQAFTWENSRSQGSHTLIYAQVKHINHNNDAENNNFDRRADERLVCSVASCIMLLHLDLSVSLCAYHCWPRLEAFHHFFSFLHADLFYFVNFSFKNELFIQNVGRYLFFIWVTSRACQWIPDLWGNGCFVGLPSTVLFSLLSKFRDTLLWRFKVLFIIWLKPAQSQHFEWLWSCVNPLHKCGGRYLERGKTRTGIHS